MRALSSKDYIEKLDISDAFRASFDESKKLAMEEMRKFVPSNEQEWMDIIAAIDAPRTADALKQLAVFDGTHEEATIAGVGTFRLSPHHKHPDFKDHLFLHFHGGAFVVGGGVSCLGEPLLFNRYLPMETISVDYRMPPANPAPAASQDGLAVYEALLQSWPANKIIMGGTSAGAGLAYSVLLMAKEKGLPMPAAVFAGTPFCDMSFTGDTLSVMENIDRILVTYHGFLGGAAALYAKNLGLKDPIVSPIYGDMKGMPPSFLVSGTRDLLLSDTVRLHRKLRDAGIRADLNVFEGQSHADYIFVPDTPETDALYRDLERFLKE